MKFIYKTMKIDKGTYATTASHASQQLKPSSRPNLGARGYGTFLFHPSLAICGVLIWFLTIMNVTGADVVFSGPQKGEKTTPFKVLALGGENAGKERTITPTNTTVLVFMHALERSAMPLLRVIDQYAKLRTPKIASEVVFLFADRIEGEQRVKAASNSLKLFSSVGLSLDGAEGPGNYGLNKNCLMTILITKDSAVSDNFALVQAGIADAPRLISALAASCGDLAPPTVEQLSGNRGGQQSMRQPTESTNQAAVAKPPPREPFPGAVPTDAKLNTLVRQVIRPNTEPAKVDQLLDEIRAHTKGNLDLQKQTRDAWLRILHFGDRYGTEYSRKRCQEMLDQLKKDFPVEK